MTAPRKRTYIGIDISKATLDVAAPGFQFKVPNNLAGFREILKRTRLIRFKHFVCEPTGIYGRDLIAYLRGRRSRLTVVDSFRARQFAKASGRLAKTDSIDAQMLAHCGTSLQLPVSPASDALFAPHIEAVRFRRQLEQHLRSLDLQRPGLLRRENFAAMDAVRMAVTNESKACGKRIANYVAGTPRLAELNRRLRLAVGISQRAAETLTGRTPRAGEGRPQARSTLYMCALSASVRNPILKAFYQRLRASRKPTKVALIAVARKLLVYLNHLAADSYAGPRPAQGPRRKFGSLWTDAERQRLHSLQQAGVTCKLIALELGSTEFAIYKQLRLERLRATGRLNLRNPAEPGAN